jgi:molybdenum cofactor cytidylyltransferase
MSGKSDPAKAPGPETSGPAADVVGLLLAAGASRRMGTPKLLLPVEGRSLLRHAAEAACRACARVVVVLGPDPERHARELAGLPVEVVANAAYESGMSSSIRVGLAAAQRHNPEGVLVLLADQPMVRGEYLTRLLDLFRTARSGRDGTPPLAAASRYPDSAGPPAVFSRRVFDELARLEGDRGAKAVIAAHERETEFLDLEGSAVDVDTPEDWEALRAREA